MANEVTAAVSITYDDGVRSQALAIAERIFTSAGKNFIRSTQLIPTSGALLDLGAISAVGAILIANRDDTNFVTVWTGNGEKSVGILRPDTDADGNGGFVATSEAASNFQAPYLVANTDDCEVEYIVVEV